ncbi:MAG: serine hydrolase domain-containing protein [Bryobacteraceae bacterium]
MAPLIPVSDPLTRRAILRRVPINFLGGTILAQQYRAPPPAIEAETGRLLKTHSVPGVSLAFVENGAIAWVAAKGVADSDAQRPITLETPFEAASLAKPVFAYLVLTLCQDKKLTLDTQLGQVLDAAELPAGDQFQRVTVQQILTHSSGIQVEPTKGKSVKFEFAPGSRFLYSPHAFDYLQRLVEKLTRQPLRTLIKDIVLRPLNMTGSDFDWTPSFAENRAVGYDAKGGRGRTINERFWRMTASERETVKTQYPYMNFPNAASSLTTTASDYARFLLAALSPVERVPLSQVWISQMLTPRISAGPGVDWGLGFGLLNSAAHGKGFWHWGDWGIFQNFAVGFPQAGIGLVSLTNGARGQRINKRVSQLAFREDLPCFRWLRV